MIHICWNGNIRREYHAQPGFRQHLYQLWELTQGFNVLSSPVYLFHQPRMSPCLLSDGMGGVWALNSPTPPRGPVFSPIYLLSLASCSVFPHFIIVRVPLCASIHSSGDVTALICAVSGGLGPCMLITSNFPSNFSVFSPFLPVFFCPVFKDSDNSAALLPSVSSFRSCSLLLSFFRNCQAAVGWLPNLLQRIPQFHLPPVCDSWRPLGVLPQLSSHHKCTLLMAQDLDSFHAFVRNQGCHLPSCPLCWFVMHLWFQVAQSFTIKGI